MLSAYLVDPFARTITPVTVHKDVDGHLLTDIYRQLECQMFDVVEFGENKDYCSMYVDDEGLYVYNQKFFMLNGETPIAGRALLFGPVGEDGETTSCVMSLETICTHITF